MSEVLSHRQLRQVAGRLPSLGESRFDRLISWELTVAVILAIVVTGLIAVWSSRVLSFPADSTPPLGHTILTGSGLMGSDGMETQAVSVILPELDADDPAVANDQATEDLEEMVDRVVTFAAEASMATQGNEMTDAGPQGLPTTATGSGGGWFGQGDGLENGASVEKRWLIQYSEEADLQSYASLLTFFNIEIGVVRSNGDLICLSQPGAANRVTRSRVNHSDERLFMFWVDHERRAADLALLNSAGVDHPDAGRVVHFYPRDVEQMLSRLEREFGGRSVSQIRRTIFSVRRAGTGFQFYVVRQKLNSSSE